MLYLIVGILAVSLAIYSMISISMSSMEKQRKMIWFAIVVLVPIIGPVIYYSIKPNRALQR